MCNIRHKQPRDENGERHGEWICYYDNGQLKYRWNFIHDLEHGLFKSYTDLNELMYCGNFNMGRKVGYFFYNYKPNEYHLWII